MPRNFDALGLDGELAKHSGPSRGAPCRPASRPTVPSRSAMSGRRRLLPSASRKQRSLPSGRLNGLDTPHRNALGTMGHSNVSSGIEQRTESRIREAEGGISGRNDALRVEAHSRFVQMAPCQLEDSIDFT
jgi:hypothetical protein